MHLFCQGIFSHKPRLTGFGQAHLHAFPLTNAVTLDASGTGMTLPARLVSRFAVLRIGVSVGLPAPRMRLQEIRGPVSLVVRLLFIQSISAQYEL